MRKGEIRTMEIDGKERQVSFLGKGRFSTCWAENDRVWCYSNDVAKECLALWGEDIKHVPQWKVVDHLGYNQIHLYKGTLYEPLMAKDKEAWQQFKILKHSNKVARGMIRTYSSSGHFWRLHGYDVAQKTIDVVRDKLPEPLVLALESILDCSANLGSSVTFEFAKRNLAMYKGDLILLDIVFDTEKV